ncbi:hypothetical protein ACTHOQ_08255 [Solibacillus silvestris]|uniref:hypothetical protein n=1 Tax=Solibacillus silvestris TaxID=76853 RepID=UPI003F7CE7F6
MNEIKRQLNRKMGATSGSADRIMTKVNEQKKKKKQPKRPNRLYYATFTAFLALIAIAIFMMKPWSANDFNQAAPPPSEQKNEFADKVLDEGLHMPLQNYFKQDGDVAYFLGTGNEYAGFTEKTKWLSDSYVEVTEDNTGATMQNIYRIQEDSIELIYQEIADPETKKFTIAQLEGLEAIQTILKWPIENDASFNGKKVTYPIAYKTPYKIYENAVQITESTEFGKEQFYYAEGSGLIAKTFITNDEYEVVSVLASINEKPNPNTEEIISFKNIATNEEEKLPLNKMTFLDPLLFYKSDAEKFEMTYEPLFTYNDAEIGVFKYDCAEQFCEMAFVKRNYEDITFGSVVWGTLQSFKRSPNLENVIFSITLEEFYDGAVLTRTMLHVLNVNTMQTKSPNSFEHYFSDPFYPINHYEWIDDTTIQAEVADIDDYESETILKWQQSHGKKTKVIEVSLPQ